MQGILRAHLTTLCIHSYYCAESLEILRYFQFPVPTRAAWQFLQRKLGVGVRLRSASYSRDDLFLPTMRAVYPGRGMTFQSEACIFSPDNAKSHYPTRFASGFCLAGRPPLLWSLLGRDHALELRELAPERRELLHKPVF